MITKLTVPTECADVVQLIWSNETFVTEQTDEPIKIDVELGKNPFPEIVNSVPPFRLPIDDEIDLINGEPFTVILEFKLFP